MAVLVYDGVAPFEFGVLCEGFGIDRRADGVPAIDFAVCSPDGKPVRTSMGFVLEPEYGLERAAEADLVAIPAAPRQDWDNAAPTPVAAESVIETVRVAHDRGARILSVCSGAFTLGEAGLLDERECTTHWMYTDELARRYPRARVVPEVLYVDAGQVVTSAGTAAGIDACLHIWRQEYGAAVANAIARRMVVPPQRDGGQAQYVARPVADCEADTLSPLLVAILEDLAADHSVESLARRAHMSPRTFARRFRDETGTTPHAWITRQRVLAAEELLEQGDEPIERIAQRVGFANAATLRAHFRRQRGISPQAYRRRFTCTSTEATG